MVRSIISTAALLSSLSALRASLIMPITWKSLSAYSLESSPRSGISIMQGEQKVPHTFIMVTFALAKNSLLSTLLPSRSSPVNSRTLPSSLKLSCMSGYIMCPSMSSAVPSSQVKPLSIGGSESSGREASCSSGAAGCSGAFAQPKTSRAHIIRDIMTVSFLIRFANFLSRCADIIIIEIPDFVSGAASHFTDCTYLTARSGRKAAGIVYFLCNPLTLKNSILIICHC